MRALAQSGGAQRFRYDAANRLVQVLADNNTTVLAGYTYGDSNERLISEEGGLRTYYVWDGTCEYVESGGATTPAWSKSYVYLGGRPLSTLTPNGSGSDAVQFHHPDRLGTRLVTDPSNGTSFEQVTLPFGTALNAESTGATNKRFTSYDRSATTGLDSANNRHYDSQQGRFTQVDPIGMSASSLASPQSLNLYAYCGNDPINHVDPSGLFWGKLFGFINKVIKWIKVALAVAIIALTIWLAPGLAGVAIAKMLTMAGLLLGSALGPRWLQTAITVGLMVVGIYLQGPQIIWNFARGAGAAARALSAIGLLNVVGTVTRYLGTPQKRSDTSGDKDTKTPAVKEQTQKLTPCAMGRLRPYFPGIDLNHVDIHEGVPSYVIGNPRAYTEGNDIYFRPGEYDPHSLRGLTLIGHELTHVKQYAQLGRRRFQRLYGTEYFQLRNLGLGHQDAYEAISFEIAARKMGAIINRDLGKAMRQIGRDGGDPCPR